MTMVSDADYQKFMDSWNACKQKDQWSYELKDKKYGTSKIIRTSDGTFLDIMQGRAAQIVLSFSAMSTQFEQAHAVTPRGETMMANGAV